MKLRDDPRMTYRTIPNWPPVWIEKYSDNLTKTGEIGVLMHVGKKASPSRRCYLHITHQNKSYVGSLICDDAGFCETLYNLLGKHIGKTIAEIGDLELSQLN